MVMRLLNLPSEVLDSVIDHVLKETGPDGLDKYLSSCKNGHNLLLTCRTIAKAYLARLPLNTHAQQAFFHTANSTMWFIKHDQALRNTFAISFVEKHLKKNIENSKLLSKAVTSKNRLLARALKKNSCDPAILDSRLRKLLSENKFFEIDPPFPEQYGKSFFDTVRALHQSGQLAVKHLRVYYFKRFSDFLDGDVDCPNCPLDDLSTMKSIEKLEIVHCNNFEALHRINEIPGLKELEIFGYANLNKLSALVQNRTIKSVHLIRQPGHTRSYFTESLPTSPVKTEISESSAIKHLRISYAREFPDWDCFRNIESLVIMNHENSSFLPLLHNFPNLKSLTISYCRTLESLSELYNHPSLESVELFGCYNFNNTATPTSFKFKNHLQSLPAIPAPWER